MFAWILNTNPVNRSSVGSTTSRSLRCGWGGGENSARIGRPQQRYFSEEQLRRVIEAARLHIEDVDLENAVIHVRGSIWCDQELAPKTENALREIDIDPMLADLLGEHIGDRAGRVFRARNGSPLSGGNIRNRVLTPLLKTLGIPHAGLHAFRHSRVTMLRKYATPADLQGQWIGHSSLRTTDRDSHKELEYRKTAAGQIGLDRVPGPNGPKAPRPQPEAGTPLQATA